MDKQELEKWYDRTFNAFLSCMVIAGYLDYKNELNDIKRID